LAKVKLEGDAKTVEIRETLIRHILVITTL